MILKSPGASKGLCPEGPQIHTQSYADDLLRIRWVVNTGEKLRLRGWQAEWKPRLQCSGIALRPGCVCGGMLCGDVAPSGMVVSVCVGVMEGSSVVVGRCVAVVFAPKKYGVPLVVVLGGDVASWLG